MSSSAPAYMHIFPLDAKLQPLKDPIKAYSGDKHKPQEYSENVEKCFRVDHLNINLAKNPTWTRDGGIGLGSGEPVQLSLTTPLNKSVAFLLEKQNAHNLFNLKLFLFRAGISAADLSPDERNKSLPTRGDSYNWFSIDVEKAQIQSLHPVMNSNEGMVFITFTAESIKMKDHLSGGEGLYNFQDRHTGK